MDKDHPILKRVQFLCDKLEVTNDTVFENFGKVDISKLEDMEYEELYHFMEILENIALRKKQKILAEILKLTGKKIVPDDIIPDFSKDEE